MGLDDSVLEDPKTELIGREFELVHQELGRLATLHGVRRSHGLLRMATELLSLGKLPPTAYDAIDQFRQAHELIAALPDPDARLLVQFVSLAKRVRRVLRQIRSQPAT